MPCYRVSTFNRVRFCMKLNNYLPLEFNLTMSVENIVEFDNSSRGGFNLVLLIGEFLNLACFLRSRKDHLKINIVIVSLVALNSYFSDCNHRYWLWSVLWMCVLLKEFGKFLYQWNNRRLTSVILCLFSNSIPLAIADEIASEDACGGAEASRSMLHCPVRLWSWESRRIRLQGG